MSDSKTTTAATARRSWVACIWLALCAALVLSPAESSAQTVSAGEFSFAAPVFAVTEFDGVAVITVVRKNGSAGRVRVSYETVDDFGLTCGDTNSPAAVPDCDYTPAFGELIFDDFETTRRFMIGVMPDQALSGTKALNIRLTAVSADPEENPDIIQPVLGPISVATLNIIEIASGNLAPPFRPAGSTNFVIPYRYYWTAESAGNVIVHVYHPSGSGGEVTLTAIGHDDPLNRYGSPGLTSDGASETAVLLRAQFTDGTTPVFSPSDFTPFTTNLTFAAGQSVRQVAIPINNDGTTEFNEDIIIFLTPRGGQNPPIGANRVALVTILYDEDPAGAIDREWNPDDVNSTTPRLNQAPGANNVVRTVVIQPDQRTIVGGDFTAYNSVPRNRIARINFDGSTDLSFVPGTGADDFISSIALYPGGGPTGGKIVVGGGFTSFNNIQRNGVARLNPNGSLDTGFDIGTGANGVVRSVAVQSDGKVLIAGEFTEVNGVPRGGVARLNSSGGLDLSFDPGAGADGTVWAVAVQDQARDIVVHRAASGIEIDDYNEIETGSTTGTATIDFTVGGPTSIRVYYEGNRLLDINPAASGQTTVNYGPGADTHLTIVINEGALAVGPAWSYTATITTPNPARRIYVAGEFLMFGDQFRPGLARLTEVGAVDATFDPGGGPDGPAYALGVQADSRVLVGGSFTSFDFRSRNRLARINADGTLDPEYNVGGGANDAVYAITFQPDGKAMVGGVFTEFNHTRRMGLTRLFVNGTVDTSFLDTGYNQFAGLIKTFHYETPNYVNSIALQANGDVLIGGSFTNLGGNFAAEVNDRQFPITQIPFDVTDMDFSFDDYIYWNRSNKRARYNVARLLGGYTLGPGNMEFVYGQNTTDENAGVLDVAMRRIDGRLGEVGTLAATTNNLAIAGDDFEDTQDFIVWGGGFPYVRGVIGEQLFRIPILPDSTIEGDELFAIGSSGPYGSVDLTGEPVPTGGALGRSRSIVTITDDDFSRGVFAFSAPTYSTNEGAVFARITVVRTNGNTGLVSVRYFTRDESAFAGSDYTAAQGVLTFASGITSQTLSVRLTDDFIVEGDETFSVTLTNATGGATIGPGGSPTATLSAQVKIIDNDLLTGKANFVSATYATNEGARFAQISLERLGGSVGELSVSVGTVSGGTATIGTDYIPLTNIVTWVHGDVARKFVTVEVNEDLTVEADETVRLRIFNPSVTLGVGSVSNATLTIRNDDFYGSLSFAQAIYDADERGTNVLITVVRTGGSGGTVAVNYSVVNGSAVNGTDFIASGGTLTFGPGVVATNFAVTILNNGLTDGDRTAILNLSGFLLATPGANPSSILRIIDDESTDDPAGELDTSFTFTAGANDSINAMALQPDGKILAAGAFRMMNRVTRTRIARLHPDGLLDDTFDPRAGPNAQVRAMALQLDGRVVIAGQFTQVAGTNRNYIARLLADGTVDNGFNPGGGADNPVFALALLADGGVVAGGAFATVNGIARPGIAVLDYDGTVRSSFDPGVGANASVLSLAVQNDGKILMGGDFTSVNGSAIRHLARLHPNGTIDTTFNPGTGPDGAVRAITLQPDGGILIGGTFTNVDGAPRSRIARLLPTGALDTLFQNGTGGADADVTAIAIQFDTKILVAGEFNLFNGVTRSRLTRLNPNGKTDPSINFGAGANDTINSMLVQPDRRIVIGGRFTAYDNEPRQHIARIHGGSVAGPGTFQFGAPLYVVSETSPRVTLLVTRRGGTAGDITLDYASTPGTATAPADYTNVVGALLFPEGEVQATITVPIVNDSLGEQPETFQVTIANPSAGATIGDTPTATVLIISDDSSIGYSSAFYTVNENVIGGNLMVDVVRTGATNGEAKVNYATTSGTALPNIDYRPRSGVLTFQPGQTTQTFTVPIIDDSLIEVNETFGLILSNVVGTAALGLTNATVTIVDNDFKAGVLAFSAAEYGVSEAGATVTLTVIRTNGATGVITVDYATVNGAATPDVDYASTVGSVTFIEGQTNRTISIPIIDDLEVEGDEDFMVVLTGVTGGAILSNLTNATVNIQDDETGPGSLDRNFDPGAGANGLVRSLALQSDGKVVLGGAFTAFDLVGRNFLARINDDGSHDLTFDPGVGPNGFVSSVAVTPTGFIAAGGTFSLVDGLPYNRIALLEIGGTPVPFFSASAGLNAEVYFVTAQPDSRLILAGGFSQPSRGITRLQPGGTVDASFSPGSAANGAVHWVLVQPDGMVVIGGAFSEVSGEPHRAVARLTTEGFVDTSFAGNALSGGTVFSIARQTDGRLIVVGDFSVGATRVNVARLNTDGTLDNTFNAGTGANATIYSVGLQSAGEVLVGGDFTSINGTNRNRIARLTTSGALDLAFDPGRGANNTVFSIIVLSSDDIVIGGDFSRVSGVSRGGVARLRGGAAPLGAAFMAASLSGGTARFTATVQAGRTYVVEASGDLTHWMPVSTNTPTTSVLEFTDGTVNQHGARFFRVRRTD